MEKSAAYQTLVYNEKGILWMRMPSGTVLPYDGRFNDCPPLTEGNQFIKPISEE